MIKRIKKYLAKRYLKKSGLLPYGIHTIDEYGDITLSKKGRALDVFRQKLFNKTVKEGHPDSEGLVNILLYFIQTQQILYNGREYYWKYNNGNK